MLPEKDREILSKYIPESAVNDILFLIEKENVRFKIAPERSTRKGDYCCPYPKKPIHQISVNRNLNQYEFLWVTLHEFAHLEVWKKFKNKVQPHGIEWKAEFRNLIQTFLLKNSFPPELAFILQNHIQNPAATANRDIFLTRAFRKYDTLSTNETQQIELAMLSLGAEFEFKEKRFLLLEKRRTRYLCKLLVNGRSYLVSNKAFVTPVLTKNTK